MASNVPRQPEKISADCPHCGFSQLESAFAKTTFCRKCGEHYSIEKLLAKEAASLKGPSFFDKISKLDSGEKERSVSCFSCPTKHVVSTAAQSSQCPSCGSYIDLRDFKIAGAFGRSIQTQGEVTITSKGDVTSAKVACATGWIEGKVRNAIICTGDLHVRVQGKLAGGVDTENLIVEKKAEVEFVRPVKARAVEINGKASAIIHCDGCVTIHKGGIFDGTIYAKSVNFDQGSFFTGELHIGEKPAEQTDLIEPVVAKVAPVVEDELELAAQRMQKPAPKAAPIRAAGGRRRV